MYPLPTFPPSERARVHRYSYDPGRSAITRLAIAVLATLGAAMVMELASHGHESDVALAQSSAAGSEPR